MKGLTSSPTFKFFAVFTAFNFLFQLGFPTLSLALTGGPSRPESGAFVQSGVNELVNPFTGDFSYNIPLLNVPGPGGGYPINLSYQSGISMEQEASWVGLGWNLDAGAVTRNMRGIPDDFDGANWNDDAIKKVRYSRPMRTVRLTLNDLPVPSEAFGADAKKALDLGLSYGVYYNNYRGFGFSFGINLCVSSTQERSSDVQPMGSGLSGSLGFNYDSNGGLSFGPSISYAGKLRASLGATVASNRKYNGARLGLQNGPIRAGYSMTSGESGSYSVGIGGITARGSGSSFNHPTGIPGSEFPQDGFDAFLQVKGGGQLIGITADLDLEGSYSETKISDNEITFPAFGWLYLQNRNVDNDGVGQTLADFNRENDGPVNATSPALSIPSATYDIFHISGQGVGGTARIFRNDIGIFSEPEIKGYTNGGGFGLEANIGNGEGSVGANPKSLYSETYSGPWTSDDDQITEKYGFNTHPVNNTAEVTYMKMLGDMAMSQSFGSGPEYSSEPAYIGIGERADGKKMYHTARKYFDDGSEMSDGMIDTRARRSQHVQYYTNAQVNDLFDEDYGSGLVDNHNKADNHIGRISVTNPDGVVYNYGYPVYNTFRKDVSFSIGAAPNEYGTTVSYNSTDNSSSNDNGRSNTYQHTETPNYSYAHMLTSVVSNDYVDVTGNGPSEDDFGSYTTFRYKKNANSGEYHWRTPYGDNQANINEGLYDYDGDNIASFSYGTKQVVYLQYIETKTHLAEFVTKHREDGLGVQGADGDTSQAMNDRLQRLSEIILYVKDPTGGSNHKEIKRVHFEYDYSLCGGASNNSEASVDIEGKSTGDPAKNVNADEGKLTLTKVYFSHQENLKGALSPYIFTYADNPDYELGYQDSWGSYQTRAKAFGNNTYENPFTNQYADFDDGDQLSSTNSIDARNDAASAWNLSKIDLPSGGEINIAYEPDDYAYVQDKPAMNMVRIVDTGESTGHDGGDLKKKSKRIYFRLNAPIKTGTGASDELDKYFKNDDEIYFKTYMKLKGLPSAPTTNIYDYVSGYFNRKAGGYNTSYGFDASTTETNLDGEGGDYYIDAWVDLELVQLADNSSGWGDVNPIRKAALQHIKFNRADLGEGSMGNLGNISHARHLVKPVNELLNFLDAFGDLFMGYYNKAINAGYGNEIKVDDANYPSFLRLHCPDQRYGGGHRVSKITFNDGWDDINNSQTGFDDHEYGQTYQYVLEDGTSSGVAEYEPMAGGEENPFRKPLRYDRDEMVSNEKAFYLEEPFNQNLMPSANVGYSRVVVKNLESEDPIDQSTNTLTGTETKVLEYYTSRDYPVRVARSSLEHKPFEWSNPMKFIGSKFHVSNGYSQGFSIELNDMHGKAKSVASYAYYSGTGSLPNAVTKEYYYYKTEGGSYKSGAANYLNNTVNVIGNDVNTSAEIGVNRDLFVAMRENSNYSQADEYVTNFFTLYGVTAGYEMKFFENTWSLFREISTNKVIARNGILTKTVRSDEGKITVAHNHQFDATTGLPVYTSINNGFQSSVYNYDQSAYWSFEGMEPAYERIGITVNGEASGSAYLRRGDVCLDEDGSVYYVDDTNPGSQTVDLVDDQDNSVNWPQTSPPPPELPEDKMMTVVRSTKQNMLSQKAHGITAVGDVLASLNSPLLDHMSVGSNNFFGEDDYKNCSDDDMHFVAYFNKVYTPPTVDIQQIVIFTARGANPNEPWGCPIYLNFPGEDDSSDPDNLGFDMEAKFSISGNIIAENPFNESSRFTLTYYTGKNWITTWSAESVTSGCSDCEIFFNQDGGISIANASGDTLSTTSIEGNSGTCKLTCYPGIVQSYARSFHDDWTYDYEDAGLSSSLITDIGDNPYRYGSKGIMRPYQQFVYVNNRSQRSPTDISQDGMLEYFAPFDFAASDNGYWELASTVSQYSPYGVELENKNEFNSVRSVAIYNPDHIFPLAVAANANYEEVAYTGFEETDPSGGVHEGRIKFELSGGGNVTISTSEAHTGEASLRVGSTDVEYDVSLTSNSDPYFEPEADKDYFFSVWVNLDGNTQGNVKFDINSGTVTTFQTSDTEPEIEGWQQVRGKMNIPSTATSVKVILESDDGSNIYFDDFRIHPFKGNMKAYVYDLETQRLEAELDDNNYATFYNYDDEGQLFQVKKETENGISTISTHRKNTRLNH